MFQSRDLIIFVWKHRKTFLIVSVVALILSAIFSGPSFIRQKFKSTAVVYATTTPSISQALTVEDNPYRKNVMEFGLEEETEQLIQVLNSDAIKEQIIKEFNLGAHYKLNPKDEAYAKLLDYLYGKHVSISKNEYLAIEIEVTDYQIDTAAMIANRIVELGDKVNSDVRKKRSAEAYQILQNYYQDVLNEIDSLNTYAKPMFEEGYTSLELQAERLTEQYGIALRNNNLAGAKRLKADMKALGQQAPVWFFIEQKIENLHESLEVTRVQLANMKLDNQYNMASSFVINKALPALKKSYPIRWLIVLASLILSLVSTLLVLYFNKAIKELKAEL
ncbi:MAG: Wzz/FepE/Etk N-terminal domain-containing protein [Flavobacteriales bacterium]